MKKRILFTISTIAISSLMISGCSRSSSENETLVFSGAPLTPTLDGKPNSYQLLIDLIAKETGKKVEYRESTDRSAIIEGVIAGQVDFAAVDPYGYVLASALDSNIRLAGAYTRGPKQRPGFTSLAIARLDSDISNLADAKGKRICFSDPASTAGFLYPAKGLASAGIPVNSAGEGDFESIFSGIVPSQPAVNVYKGTCDVGFIPNTQWLGVMKTLKTIKMSELKIVWESEHIPGSVLMIGSHLPEDLSTKIVDSITMRANKTYFASKGLCESETDCNFLNVANWGYVAVKDSDYDPVRETCANLGIKQCLRNK